MKYELPFVNHQNKHVTGQQKTSFTYHNYKTIDQQGNRQDQRDKESIAVKVLLIRERPADKANDC